MVFWIALGLGAVTAWIVAQIYNKYTTQDEKDRFENWVKLHHGEAGFIVALIGFLIKSPTTIGAGTGLMYHDRKDIPKWFSGDKYNSYDQVTGMA